MKLAIAILCTMMSVASAADYPVAFLAYPRTIGYFPTQSVSSDKPGQYVHHVGTDLVIAYPDGTERLLVKGDQPGTGLQAIHDFCVDLDGHSIVYSHIESIPAVTTKRCDLWRVDLDSGSTVRLTNSAEEWNPPWGAAQFSPIQPANQNTENNNRVYKGLFYDRVWNIGPCVCGDGSIVFSSNREAMRSPSEQFQPAFQLFRMDADGGHVRLIGHMNLAGALHPTLSRNGRLVWSSAEQQGGRKGYGSAWGLWSINPDGSDWRPEISAIGNPNPFHWQTETTDGSLVAAQYYSARIYGALRVAPPFVATPFGPPTQFGHPLLKREGYIRDGTQGQPYAYMRRGFYTPAPWAWIQDQENVNVERTEKPGMISHPSAIPGNGILLTWTGSEGELAMNLGIYAIPDIKVPSQHFSDLVKVVDDPTRHEWLARPVVPFSAIYGIAKPTVPRGETDRSLPPGSPFGTVSTSSMAWPEIVHPQFGPATGNPVFKNFALADAQYIRVLAFNKTTTNASYLFEITPRQSHPAAPHQNADGFRSAFNERTGAYEEVPLYKYRTLAGTVHYGPDPPSGSTAILDPEGKPDTSFRIQIPANQPWTFQVLNAKKEAVGTAQTWHQVIPGEYRTCGGCHTHHGAVPFAFEQSFAFTEEYQVRRLDKIRTAVWERDIKPIVEEHSLPILKLGWESGILFYNSDETTADDDPRLSREQAELIRLWIDTGMMSESKFIDYKRTGIGNQPVTETSNLGPYADTQPPTVAHAVFPTQVILGLFDPQAGVDTSSLSVTCTHAMAGRAAGADLADLFVRDEAEHRWILTTEVPQTASMTVSVRDLQVGINLYGEPVGPGNLTRVSFPLTPDGESPPPPPDPDAEEIARLRAAIQDISDQVALLLQQQAELQEQLNQLLGDRL